MKERNMKARGKGQEDVEGKVITDIEQCVHELFILLIIRLQKGLSKRAMFY